MKRWLVLLYGGACYLFFLATFLFLAGFIGGFWVPVKLDGTPRSPLMESLFVDATLVVIFGLQHSFMARPKFKERLMKIIPPPIERSTYVLATNLALALMFWQWRPIGGIVWQVTNPIAIAMIWILFGVGWLTVLVTTFLINHFDLFGLRQVWLYFRGRPYTPLSFVTPGPYQFIRHPLYVGWLMAFWASPTMTIAHLVFAIAMTWYILVAIVFEERDLVRYHSAYVEYRKRVPMLLPIDYSVFSDISWWHWTLTIPLLIANLMFDHLFTLPVAIVLCGVVSIAFVVQSRSLQTFPVQVRLVYMILLMLSLLPGLRWIRWVQLVGTISMVTIGYCPLAHLLRLVPWNRMEPLSTKFVLDSLFFNDFSGGVLRWPTQRRDCNTSCSMNRMRPSLTAAQIPIEHA